MSPKSIVGAAFPLMFLVQIERYCIETIDRLDEILSNVVDEPSQAAILMGSFATISSGSFTS